MLLLRLITFNDAYTRIHGTILLGDGSARRRNLKLNTRYSQETAMPPAGFESTIPARERPKTYASERGPPGLDSLISYHLIVPKRLTFSLHNHCIHSKYNKVVILLRSLCDVQNKWSGSQLPYITKNPYLKVSSAASRNK